MEVCLLSAVLKGRQAFALTRPYFLFIFILGSSMNAQLSKSIFDDLPSDLRPTNPLVRALLEKAAEASQNGNRDAARESLDDALKAAGGEELSDKALVEASLGAWETFAGGFEQAGSYFDSALKDSEAARNSALIADVLVSKSSLLRIHSKWDDALGY